ncbi:rhomboid family intramembrane serine protease [Xanthomonas translucens]|uniref:rhomboid family intramembrane serine protease n=1 Tax=Xanthomonas campestris pv. translucens TaxID=343 RepID=UPI003CE4B46F
MLILPLHKPLSRENFPLVTLLLLLLNVAVYLGWQRQDAVPLQQAQRYYLDSGLGAHEAPAYAHYLRRSGREDALAQFERVPAAQQAEFVGGASLNDVRFVQALRSGEALEDPAAQQAWAPLRARYDALLDRVFTLRHLQRSSEWSPARMLSSAFLHADGLHLFGNMLFLVVLGTLLEGAIGRWRFLLVYLLGAFGASAVSLAWRWARPVAGWARPAPSPWMRRRVRCCSIAGWRWAACTMPKRCCCRRRPRCRAVNRRSTGSGSRWATASDRPLTNGAACCSR